MKRLFFGLLLLMCLPLLWAQNSSSIDRRVVYLWDVTYSMHGGYYAKSGNGSVVIAGQEHSITRYDKKHDIYDKVLEKLVDAIKNVQDPNAEIVVVPFGAKVLKTWTYRATDEGKAALECAIRSFCELDEDKVQMTNIGGVLKYTIDHIFDASHYNTLYLLTDGIDNVNPEQFNEILNNWCSYCMEKNATAFYMVLAKEAINPDLRERLEKNCMTVVVNPNIIVASISEFSITGPNQVSLEDNFNDSKINLEVSVFDSHAIQGSVKIKVTSVSNNYISVDSEISIDSQTRTVSLPMMYKQSLPDLKRTMTTNEKGTPITLKMEQVSGFDKNSLRTQELTFNIINKELKTLQIEIVK